MINKTLLQTTVAFGVVGLILITPASVEARHNDSSYSRAISALDDDAVEEFAIPILFGVKLKNIEPNFGDMRGGGTRLHEGQDIMGILGTPIISPTEAVVTGTGYGESAGNYVYTANPGGERFVYMHLDEIGNIKAGDIIEAGDYIGTVGDTGNAKGAGAHLHFEIHTDEPTDPFPRITEELTLKEKMVIVKKMFRDLDDEKGMAKFLVENFRSDFQSALNSTYDLPTAIKTALKKEGVVDTSALMTQLESIIASIPKVVTKDLALGDQGAEVSLIQIFLIYEKAGPLAEKLSRSGATGYFGGVTEAALMEYQESVKLKASGLYDKETRLVMGK